jgi:HK97 family phage portal protein
VKNPFLFFSRARDKPGRQPSPGRRPSPENVVSSAPTFYFGSSTAGKSVTAKTAIQMSTVYACVRVIAETIASLPLHVYQADGQGSKKATEHPLYRILHDEPNAEMTSFVLRETMLSHLLLYGNAYCQIVRNGRGHILGLYPLLPDQMNVDRDSGGRLTYDYNTRDGKTVRLRPEDVLHIPGLGFDGIMGYSPIALEKNAIGLGLAAEEYGSKFFSNGATPSGVLTHPNTVKDPKRLRESWNAAYGGSSNSGKVAILEEGMQFARISMPNNEAQFLETRKFQVSEICRIYRVPPHLVGDLEHATFSNIEHQGISFAVHTIRPWLVRIEQAMNRALFPEKEKVGSPGGRFYVRFNMDGLMRGAYKERMEGYAIGRQNGWLSTNDIRELENMNPVPEDEGGNALLVNGNMLPVKAILAKADLTSALTEGLLLGTPEPVEEPTEEADEETNNENGGKP